MKLHIIRSIAVLFFLFSGSVASAQTEADHEACIQAMQARGDALSASDYKSFIRLTISEMELCSWHYDVEDIANFDAEIAGAYYLLGELDNAKRFYNICIKIYYSQPNCHYWLAKLSLQEGDYQTFVKEKELAKIISLRIISNGVPSYLKDKVIIIKTERRIVVAKEVLNDISKF
jgi:hypothetical protein